MGFFLFNTSCTCDFLLRTKYTSKIIKNANAIFTLLNAT